MNEKLIEKKLTAKVKKLGGIALKFSSPYNRGWPDRFVIMPNGKIAFAEIKTTGKKPTPTQAIILDKLKSLGHIAEVVDSEKTLTEFIEKLKRL